MMLDTRLTVRDKMVAREQRRYQAYWTPPLTIRGPLQSRVTYLSQLHSYTAGNHVHYDRACNLCDHKMGIVGQ